MLELGLLAIYMEVIFSTGRGATCIGNLCAQHWCFLGEMGTYRHKNPSLCPIVKSLALCGLPVPSTSEMGDEIGRLCIYYVMRWA